MIINPCFDMKKRVGRGYKQWILKRVLRCGWIVLK